VKDFLSFFTNLPKNNIIIFIIGLSGIVISMFGIHIWQNPSYIRFFDNMHWTFGTVSAAILAFLGYRNSAAVDAKKTLFWFLLGFAGYAIGQIVWDIQTALSYSGFPSPSDIFYLWLGSCISIGLFYEVYTKNTKNNIHTFQLDLLSLSIAALALILISYLPRKGDLDILQIAVLVSYPVTLLIPALMMILMIPTMRLRVDSRVVLFLVATSITAWSWMHWNSLALDGITIDGSWFNVTFSIAILVSGLVVSNWQLIRSENIIYDRISEGFLKFLPIFTVILSSLAIIILTSNPQASWLIHQLTYFGSAIVIVLSILRQSRLLNERDLLLDAQAEALKSAHLIKTIIQTIPVRIFWKDRDLNYLGCNDLFARDAGFEHAEEMIGKNDFEAGWKEQADLYRADDFRVIKSGKATLRFEEPQTTPDGKQIWLQTSKAPLIDESNGEIIGVLGIYDDITERKNMEQQLNHIAHYDPLTNLPNRLLLSDRLRQAILQSKRRNTIVAVAYFDLDGFKEVNDTYGHEIGDHLLITISNNLKAMLRKGDTFARLGGDEFVAVFQDITDPTEVISLLDRMLHTVSHPIKIDENHLRVSASIGVTFYPQEEEIDGDQLIRQGDQAMYQAKQSGKNRYFIFDLSHKCLQSLNIVNKFNNEQRY